MKIVTWNVNGLRSMKTSVQGQLNAFNADVICFQETKITRDLLREDIAIVEGYSSYFSFSKKQLGYSGVATYCNEKCTPQRAEEGLSGCLSIEHQTKSEEIELDEYVQPSDLCKLDSEGRTVITYHEIRHDNEASKTLATINVYCPRVDPEKPERHIFKMQFCHLLAAKARALCRKGCYVIIVGDLNIAHHTIDHCDPGDEKEFNENEARVWLSSFLTQQFDDSGEQFLDAFRHLHPLKKEAYTCWNTLTGARQTNYGTRIDYVLISYSLLPLLNSCEILPDIHGSDHCPVVADFNFETTPSARFPLICTRLYPEFAGKQQKLKTFFEKHSLSKSPYDVHKKINPKSPLKVTNSTKKNKVSSSKEENQKSIKNFFAMNKSADQGMLKKNVENQCCKPDLSSKKCEGTALEEGNLCGVKNSQESTKLENSDIALNNLQVCLKKEWKSLLCGPPKAPVCKGHNKLCVLRTVKKEGINFNRQFYVCSQPPGPASNPNSRCNFFQWVESNK